MSVILNRSASAFLRLSHTSKYQNGLFLAKGNKDINARPNSSHPCLSDAGMKVDNKTPDVLLNFDHEDCGVPSENFSNSANLLLHSDSNLRPKSARGNLSKADSTNNAETEEEGETDNGSHSGISTIVTAEKCSNKQVKKKKRAKSGRKSRNHHGNSSKGKRHLTSNTKSGTMSTAVKVKSDPGSAGFRVKDLVNGVAGLGILDASICKPVVLHKPSSQERKNGTMSENVRKREIIENNRITSKSASSKVVVNSMTTKSVTLPQMSNNFMVKSDPVLRFSVGSEGIQSSRSFVQQFHKLSNKQTEEITRITKIYLSERHSGMLKDCGMEVPMAPPATPTPDQLRKVEYIPSMNDIRSQRAVKVRLQVLEKEAQKKSARRREEVAKQEKQNLKEREKELKQQQRQEIYALNKVMTELENSRFKEFCIKKGIDIS